MGRSAPRSPFRVASFFGGSTHNTAPYACDHTRFQFIFSGRVLSFWTQICRKTEIKLKPNRVGMLLLVKYNFKFGLLGSTSFIGWSSQVLCCLWFDNNVFLLTLSFERKWTRFRTLFSLQSVTKCPLPRFNLKYVWKPQFLKKNWESTFEFDKTHEMWMMSMFSESNFKRHQSNLYVFLHKIQ